jgi:hypothetical protein
MNRRQLHPSPARNPAPAYCDSGRGFAGSCTAEPISMRCISSRACVLIFTVLVTAILCSAPFSSLSAQEQTSGQASTEESAQKLEMPGDERITVLINSTLIALNQANATGNYSVFRELGAPGFQVVNSSAELADIFATLRSRDFDLSPIVRLQPKLIRPPELKKNGMLRVAGFFDTTPERLNFDLIFQPVNGRWLLFGIAVDTTPGEPATAQGEAEAPSASKQVAEEQTAPAPPPAPNVKPSKLAPTGTPQARAKPALPDVRDIVDQTEAAETAPAKAKSEPSDDDDSPFNPLGWF